jgi:hypothetical protein
VRTADYQQEDSQSYTQLMPLGVIAFIYEAFPDLGAIAAGFCIKTGNSIILKGSTEASNSNTAIANSLQTAITKVGLPAGCVELITAEHGASVRDLVTQDQYLNLVIPYGRSSLIQQVVRQATCPVLKSAMGNCYLYWSVNSSLEMIRWMIIDSHESEPDQVNAIEKVLVHRQALPSSLSVLWSSLKEKGFQLKGDAELVAAFPQLQLAKDEEWGTPYLTKTVAFKLVDSLDDGMFKDVKFTYDQMREIRYASLLHDFGKVGVREKVLVKSKKLESYQLDIIKWRFYYLIKDLEAKFNQKKLDYLKANGSSEFTQYETKIDSEFALEKERLSNLMEIVIKCNEPTVLEQSSSNLLDDIAKIN